MAIERPIASPYADGTIAAEIHRMVDQVATMRSAWLDWPVVREIERAVRRYWWDGVVVAGVIASIAGAEWLFNYGDVGLGIAAALVIAILLNSIVSFVPFGDRVEPVLDALALVPLYILFTSSLPWFFLDTNLLLPSVYSIVMALAVWRLYEEGIGLSREGLAEIGFRRDGLIRYALIGAALAIPIGLIEYSILRPEPAAGGFDLRDAARDAIYMFAFVAVAEELLFRGVILRNLAAAFGAWRGVVVAAALFSIMHIVWRSWEEVAFTFAAGLLLGFLYQRTHSLTAPIILHATNNILLVVVLPYVL